MLARIRLPGVCIFMDAFDAVAVFGYCRLPCNIRASKRCAVTQRYIFDVFQVRNLLLQYSLTLLKHLDLRVRTLWVFVCLFYVLERGWLCAISLSQLEGVHDATRADIGCDMGTIVFVVHIWPILTKLFSGVKRP